MAYTKLRDMLELALELQVSSLGLTIDQLMLRTGRSRKTVERMLKGLADLGIEVELSRLESDHHLTKRWRLQTELPGPLLMLQPSERAALERHLQTLPKDLTGLALSKLLASQKPLSNHLAIDEEELISLDDVTEEAIPKDDSTISDIYDNSPQFLSISCSTVPI